MFWKFWKDWQNQKPKYNSINQWWESGKTNFRIFGIKFSTIKNQNINKQHQNLTKNILQKKMKSKPDKNKIENWQRSIEDTEDCKTQGCIIRYKEAFVVNEKKPTKYFCQQKKNKGKL